MSHSYGDTFNYRNHDDALHFVYAHRLRTVPIELLRKGDRFVATRHDDDETVTITGEVNSDGRDIFFLEGLIAHGATGRDYVNVKIDGANYSGNHPNQTFYATDDWTFRVAKPIFDRFQQDRAAVATKLREDSEADAKRNAKEAKLEKLLEQIADLNKKADELRNEL